MWIIPKTSEFYRFVPDTVDSNSDWPGHYKSLCESLLWRSKPSPWRTWLLRLRRTSWLSRLCGRICEPSKQKSFEDALILSLRDTRASPSASPASGKGAPTLDTFGRILRESSSQLDLFGASLRTSPDILPSNSPKFIEAYRVWVTQLRLDCLRRQSAGRRTGGSDCLSWPTMDVNGQHNRKGASENSGDGLSTAVKQWPTVQVADSKQAKFNKGGNPHLGLVMQSWPTPAAQNTRDGRASSETMNRNARPLQKVVISGLLAPDSPSTNGKNRELWPTPDALPRGCGKKPGFTKAGKPTNYGKPVQTTLPNQLQVGSSKLNPAWVEQLQGIPVGWTDCASWATE